MNSSSLLFSLVAYGVSAAGFLIFALQLAFGQRSSKRARLLAVAMTMASVWCMASAAYAGLGIEPMRAVSGVAETLHWLLLYFFLVSCVVDPVGKLTFIELLRRPHWVVRAGLPLGAVAALAYAVQSALAGGLARLELYLSAGLLMATLGGVMVEQFYRNTPQNWRWGVKPLAMGYAITLVYDLYFFSESLLFHGMDPDLWAARGAVHALAIPLYAISTARVKEWSIRLNVSREAVFHTTALVLSGVGLMVIAAAGYYVRFFGGEWGRALQTVVIAAGVLALIVLVASGSVRARLKVLINKHFFSYRYDYRNEWLRFADAMYGAASQEDLRVAVIRVLSDMVESPGGLLWLHTEDGDFRPAARLNHPPFSAVEPDGGPLSQTLGRAGGWVINLDEYRSRPGLYDGLVLPEWLSVLDHAWLVVPLAGAGQLTGFVVLFRPRATVEVNWEVRDLLKTAARQAAGVLGQMQAMEALIESRKFAAFSKMSAFVVHDLKNLISQLSLLLRNAARHRDNPEFQQDMLDTIEHAVGRMNGLLLQLRSGTQPIEAPAPVALVALLRRIERSKARVGCGVALELQGEDMTVLAHEDRVERVIGHLVQNALDATPQTGKVTVRAHQVENAVVVEVEDTGSGMTEEFIRERLFKPFQSTKPNGMGIGAYESFRYIHDLGGRIDVNSRPGEGSLFTMTLPSAQLAGTGN